MKDTYGANDKAIPILFPANVIRWLEAQGYERNELIQDTDLKADEIDSAEALISLKEHHQIILNALRITNNPHLGLYFGREIRLTNLGFVGYASVSSANIREGLQTFIKYSKLRFPIFNTQMYEKEDKVHMVYTEAVNLEAIRQFIYELLIGGVANMFQFFGINLSEKGQENTSEVDAYVSISEPKDWSKHKHLVENKINIHFDQHVTEFVFPNKYLQQESVLADSMSAKLARDICDEQLRNKGESESLISRVNHIIQSRTVDFPTLDEVAEELCVSPRTLSRELKKMDTSYQALLDHGRKTMAIKLLQGSRLTVHQISEKLGYKDPTNFGRAFRKWTGRTPGSYR